jgi:carboxypeptidase T
MKRFLFLAVIFLLLSSMLSAREMLVRVFVDSYLDLKPLGLKTVNYAGAHPGEYYDLILTEQEYYSNLVTSGLPHEVIHEDLALADFLSRGNYRSYVEMVTLLRAMAASHSSICRFDSIGQTYLGEWIYGVKISDDPTIDDPTEPDVLIFGVLHAREWAAFEVPLFFADSLTKAYASNSSIKAQVDSREIWIFPCINVDGYNYDYPGHHWWRKNRQPFGGTTGTDPNRTWNGCNNGDRFGDWGAIPYWGSVTHEQGNDVFCGPYGEGPNGNSSPCNDAISQFIESHEFNYVDSYHSYGELVLWSWGYKSATPPNNSHLVSYGTTKAGLMHRLGSGYYTPQQGYNLYPTSGGSDDWIYGWYHYVNGTNCISFTTELGTEFYQPEGDLDYICRENMKGFFYMVQQAEDIRTNLSAEVPAPTIAPMDTSYSSDYTVLWSPRNPQINNPTAWELHELTGFSHFEDNLESGTGHWVLNGFSHSTARYHSSNHSFFSGSSNNISNTVTTAFPYIVESGDSLTFWCWYDLENDYDVATVEVSMDGLEWFQLDNRYTRSQTSWTRKAYSLEPWAGKSIYIRFRAMTDDNTLEEGFYVDDIAPVPNFTDEVTISNSIADTFYSFTGKPDGQYWYKVRGTNTAYGWGAFSILEDVIVHAVDVAEDQRRAKPYSLTVYPNPFSDRVVIDLCLPYAQEGEVSIYTVSGARVKTFTAEGNVISWDGRDARGVPLPAGIYYLKATAGNRHFQKKLILLD